MKATKKIVGAASALVVAVALSAGSTFAWFSSSGTVTADGMMVQANVASNLTIVEGLKTEASAFTETEYHVGQQSATKLSPVRLDNDDSSQTLTAKTPNGFTEAPSENDPGTVAPDNYSPITGNSEISHDQYQSLGGYVMVVPMSVMQKAETNSNATATLTANVSVTWTDPAAANASYKFLRVGFQIWFNDNDGEPTYAWVNPGDMVASGGSAETTTSGSWTNVSLGTLTDNKAAEINFVVWYDGDDEDCYTNNARLSSAMSISITYTASMSTSD